MSAADQLTYEEPGALLERIANPHPFAAKDWHPLPPSIAHHLARVHDAIHGMQEVLRIRSAASVVDGFNAAFTEQAANLPTSSQEALDKALRALLDHIDEGMYSGRRQLALEVRMPEVRP